MATIKKTIKTDNLMHRNGAYFTRNMGKVPTGGVGLRGAGFSKRFQKTAATTTANLGEPIGWAEVNYDTEVGLWLKDNNGNLYLLDDLGSDITQAMDNGQSFSPNQNGIEVDQNNEVVYTSKQYMGTTVTTDLNGAVSQGDNTITVTDITGVPTSGYAIITPDNGVGHGNSTETIQYTGISGNDITGVTRGKFNTTDQNHSDEDIIIFFDDDAQDFGSAETWDRPAYRWEDKVLLGNGSDVAMWDGTTLTTAALDLPVGYRVVAFSEIPTGSGSLILIGANYGSRGEIFVWDGSADSWNTKIRMNEAIRAMHKEYIGTKRGLYRTDGYRVQFLSVPTDGENDIDFDNFYIEDIGSLKSRYILVSTSTGAIDYRVPNGVWVYDTATGEWSINVYEGSGNESSYSAITTSSKFGWTLVGSNYMGGTGLLLDGAEKGMYQVTFEPRGVGTMNLESISLGLRYNDTVSLANITAPSVVVRYFPYTRYPHFTVQTNSASASASEIVINDTQGTPQVGDRIVVVKKNSTTNTNNSLWQPRKITSVTAGAGKYTLGLDSALSDTIDASGFRCYIHPYKQAGEISISSEDINLMNLRLPIPLGTHFRKLLVEVEFRDESRALVLDDIEIEYNIWQG